MYGKNLLFTSSCLIACSLTLAGCLPVKEPSTSEIASINTNAPVEESVSQLTYFNSSVFDQGVSNEMTIPNRYILIDFTENITLNTIPERIESWLQRISNTNGIVELEPIDPDEQDRGLGLLAEPIIGLLFKAYMGDSENEIDTLTDNYNVRIYYMQDSGIVNKILFYPDNTK